MDHGKRVVAPCSERVKAGFFTGAVLGIAIGGFFGASGAFRLGLKGQEMTRHIAKNMLSVGVSFGGFMSVGTLLRC